MDNNTNNHQDNFIYKIRTDENLDKEQVAIDEEIAKSFQAQDYESLELSNLFNKTDHDAQIAY